MTQPFSCSNLTDPSAFNVPTAPPPGVEIEGTIGVLTTEWGRSPKFWLCFAQLLARLPFAVHLETKFSLNIAEARNQVMETANANGSKWLWFIDDDHEFPATLLQNLLVRNVDIVQPLVLGRYSPFGPVAMGKPTADGKAHWKIALTPELPKDGLQVEVVGAAGMLVRRHVWEALTPPWFTYGGVQPDVTSEDMVFCRAARAKGFQVWVDLENRMSHMNIGSVWPMRQDDGTWYTRVIFGNQALDFEAAQPKFKVKADGTAQLMDGTEIPNDYDVIRKLTP